MSDTGNSLAVDPATHHGDLSGTSTEKVEAYDDHNQPQECINNLHHDNYNKEDEIKPHDNKLDNKASTTPLNHQSHNNSSLSDDKDEVSSLSDDKDDVVEDDCQPRDDLQIMGNKMDEDDYKIHKGKVPPDVSLSNNLSQTVDDGVLTAGKDLDGDNWKPTNGAENVEYQNIVNHNNETVAPEILISRQLDDNSQSVSTSDQSNITSNRSQDDGNKDDFISSQNQRFDDDVVFPTFPNNSSLPSHQEDSSQSDQYQVSFKDPSDSNGGELDARPPTKTWQQVAIGMIGFGMEVCYATETAMFIPILLQMGLPDHFYSVTWFISPLLGLLLQPFIGSCSDRCYSPWGRRRPFLLVLGLGIVLGFALLLNGENIGLRLGDSETDHTIGIIVTMFGQILLDFSADSSDTPARSYMMDVFNTRDLEKSLSYRALLNGLGAGIGYIVNGINWEGTVLNRVFKQLQVVFLINGTLCALSVFVTVCSVRETPLVKKRKTKHTEDNSKPNRDDLYDAITPQQQYGTFLEPGGQSSNPNSPLLGRRSAHNSICEENADLEWDNSFDFQHFDTPWPKQTRYHRRVQLLQSIKSEDDFDADKKTSGHVSNKSTSSVDKNDDGNAPGSALQLLYSIIKMPRELRRLCISHYLEWLGMVTILLFFTDYVGQVVYHGDPKQPLGHIDRTRYQQGVHMGCWGMCIFAFSASVSAVLYGRLVQYLSYRTIFVWAQVLFAVGTGCQAIFSQNVYVTLALCLTFGFMFTSIQSTPFAILSEFHKSDKYIRSCGDHRRGLATDVSCLVCMVFLAQITVSSIIGPLINAFDSHLVIVLFPSITTFMSAIFASVFIIYEIKDDEKEDLESRTKSDALNRSGTYSDRDDDESRPLITRPDIN